MASLRVLIGGSPIKLVTYDSLYETAMMLLLRLRMLLLLSFMLMRLWLVKAMNISNGHRLVSTNVARLSV